MVASGIVVVASGSAWHFCGYDVVASGIVASGGAWHFCGYDVVASGIVVVFLWI